MNLSDLKKYFRRFVKVVPGGPTDKTRGVGMLACLDALAEEIKALPTTLPDFHSFRFRTRAEAVNNYDGETLDQLKGDDLFTHAEVLVEFWHDNPKDLNSDIIYNQRLTVEYDPSPSPQYLGWRTSGGAAADAGRVGLKLVKVVAANPRVVKQYRADQAVSAVDVRYYDDGQGVLFFTAVQDKAAPVPAPVRGQTTAYWEPADEPSGPVGGYTDTQARAAQLNRAATAGSTTIPLTVDAPTDYGTLASGAFTVDASGAQVGKVVRFACAAAAGPPAYANTTNGQPVRLLGAAYASGTAYAYSLLVCVDQIQVVSIAL